MTFSKRIKVWKVPDHLSASIEMNASFYAKIELKEFCLGMDPANCWFLTKKNQIARIINIIGGSTHSSVQLCCTEIDEKFNFFIIPIESRFLDIYFTRQDAHLHKPEKLFTLSDVKCKLVCLPYRDLQVFIPLLHTNKCTYATGTPVDDDDDDE